MLSFKEYIFEKEDYLDLFNKSLSDRTKTRIFQIANNTDGDLDSVIDAVAKEYGVRRDQAKKAVNKAGVKK